MDHLSACLRLKACRRDASEGVEGAFEGAFEAGDQRMLVVLDMIGLEGILPVRAKKGPLGWSRIAMCQRWPPWEWQISNLMAWQPAEPARSAQPRFRIIWIIYELCDHDAIGVKSKSCFTYRPLYPFSQQMMVSIFV